MTDHCDATKDDCRQVLAELHRYLDNECGAGIADSLRQHLADCPPCLDRVEFERALRDVIATKCRDAAPSHLVDRIVERLGPDPTA